MVQNEKAKTAALVLTTACIILSAVHYVAAVPQLSDVGICKDCSILARFAYSFFHANIIHTLINCWCLLSVVFLYDVSLWYVAIAYAIAVTFPINTLAAIVPHASAWEIPTVGLSAVCFVLLGIIAFRVQRKVLYHLWVLSFIAIGYILPYTCSLCGLTVAAPNNILHLYCYVAGLMVGFLNSPAHEDK